MPPDRLLLVREGALWAQTLDLKAEKTSGELQPVVSQVGVDAGLTGFAWLSVSDEGSFLYRSRPATHRLLWIDRNGRELSPVGEPEETQILISRFSPDGKSAAVRRTVKGNTDLWLLDTARGTYRRLTSEPGVEGLGVFSQDGSRIVFTADPKGTLDDIYVKNTDGNGTETPLLETPESDEVLDWSPDGKYVLFDQGGAGTSGIWALPTSGEDHKPFLVIHDPSPAFEARFSPDGRWITFEMFEDGKTEVYVQPFQRPGQRIQISAGGGALHSGPAERTNWSMLHLIGR